MYLLLTVAVIHLIACLSPGPDVFLVVLNSMRYGYRTGIATTMGILCSVAIQITLGITGVSYLIQQSERAHTLLALAGSIWLASIGIQGIRHALRKKLDATEGGQCLPAKSNLSGFSQGFFVSILNPKAILYFLSLFTVLLGPHVPLYSRIGSGIVMIAVQAVAFMAVAVLTGRQSFSQQWKRIQPWLEWGISIILLILAATIWIKTILSLMA